jgi:hypothetical protein
MCLSAQKIKRNGQEDKHRHLYSPRVAQQWENSPLANNYPLMFLPAFESAQMVAKAGWKLNAKRASKPSFRAVPLGMKAGASAPWLPQ